MSRHRSSGVIELDESTCWELARRRSLGRFAVHADDGGPDVFPMNFLVHDGRIFVRSAPGSKLRAILTEPLVAFEVDGEDERYRWSVVIRGTARRLDSDEEIEASGVLRLMSWSPTPKYDFIQLTPHTVTGRRFPRRPSVEGPDGTPSREFLPPAHDRSVEKPKPIPHFPPLPEQQ